MWALIIGVAVVFGPPALIAKFLWNSKVLRETCIGLTFYSYNGYEKRVGPIHKLFGAAALIAVAGMVILVVSMILYGCYGLGNEILGYNS